MTVAHTIEVKLAKALQPTQLEVIDESHQHAGHSGARPEGETHFRIRITAETLNTLSRVQQHQRIYTILSEEIGNPIHALAIEVVRD